MINTFFNFFASSIPIYLPLSQGRHNHLPLPYLVSFTGRCFSPTLTGTWGLTAWAVLVISGCPYREEQQRTLWELGCLEEVWGSPGFQGWMGFRLLGRKRKRPWTKAWRWRYLVGCRRIPEMMAEHKVMKIGRGSRCRRGQVGARLGNTCPLWGGIPHQGTVCSYRTFSKAVRNLDSFVKLTK